MKSCGTCKNEFPEIYKYCPVCGNNNRLFPFDLDGGKYRITRRIGRGGYGDVFLGRHVHMDVDRAVKILHATKSEPDNVRRFMGEAHALTTIDHPNVVRVYDCNVSLEGDAYLVMDYLEGCTLEDKILSLDKTGGRLDFHEINAIVRQVCDAMETIHAKRIIHRDLKPSNIFLVGETCDHIKLIDFGISKFRAENTQTDTGVVLGTLDFVSPEQLLGKKADRRSDIYGFGVTVYLLLAKQFPFAEKSEGWTINEKVVLPPRGLAEVAPNIPAPVAAVVMRAIDNRPEKRWLTALEFADEFEKALIQIGLLTPRETPRPVAPPPIPNPATPVVFHPTASIFSPPLALHPSPAAGVMGIPPEVPFRADPPPAAMPPSPPPTFLFSIPAPIPPTDRIATPALPPTFTNSIGMEFVLIPPGTFLMGSTQADEDRWNAELKRAYDQRTSFQDELPQRRVVIPYPFYLGKYPVTQEEWEAVMGRNPSFFKGRARLPVECVSWEDCRQFLDRLNQEKDGSIYRLPSEAEWEYACRAGTTGDYAGSLIEMAWYGDNSGDKPIDSTRLWGDANYKFDTYWHKFLKPNGNRTHPVGLKKANAWGLYDMHGNVWEWCQDWYHETYEGAPTDGSAWERGGQREFRVLRGGSWDNDPDGCRSATRDRSTPVDRNFEVGLRVVVLPAP